MKRQCRIFIVGYKMSNRKYSYGSPSPSPTLNALLNLQPCFLTNLVVSASFSSSEVQETWLEYKSLVFVPRGKHRKFLSADWSFKLKNKFSPFKDMYWTGPPAWTFYICFTKIGQGRKNILLKVKCISSLIL